MNNNAILEELCYYDPRNPDCSCTLEELLEDGIDVEKRLKGESFKCSCENCFYGRTELATELLKVKKAIEDLSLKIKAKADSCTYTSRESRARKGAYVDCLIELKTINDKDI